MRVIHEIISNGSDKAGLNAPSATTFASLLIEICAARIRNSALREDIHRCLTSPLLTPSYAIHTRGDMDIDASASDSKVVQRRGRLLASQLKVTPKLFPTEDVTTDPVRGLRPQGAKRSPRRAHNRHPGGPWDLLDREPGAPQRYTRSRT
ncbi:hypothetical protein BS47DRAFT_1401136 [Hydnum rufescens UP504]|uniref:Uncharacterized protein n=1 Tax=Hydnum rufescens UP504 TaxID=1448309 RepID=A0A9P6AG94_9AGAM|nr:hypothetical protein BS47DRAFT_1401136 [Hydnum rufescens UP504]